MEKITEADLPAAGHKAVSLALIARKGIFVPAGFVVLSGAFDRFCRASRIDSEISKILASINAKDLSGISQLSQEIGDLLAKHPFPKDLLVQLEDAFDTLNSSLVAVRPSAAGENPATAALNNRLASNIGVEHSLLAEYIKKSWLSFFSPSALSYLVKNGFDLTILKPAVLVQKIFDCDASGIAFSEVLTGAGKKRLVIEAGFGAASDAPVNIPDRYELNKDPLYIVEKKISLQAKMLKRQAGAFYLREVERSEQGVQKLADDQIRWLAEVVIKIERIFSSPREVEWGFHGGRIAILGCRPAEPAELGNKETTVWSNINISEILPGVLPPLVSSVMVSIFDPAFRSILQVKSLKPLMKEIMGRLYFNASAISEALALKTGIKDFPIEMIFGGKTKAGSFKPEISGKIGLMSYGIKIAASSASRALGFDKMIAEGEKKAHEFSAAAAEASDIKSLLELEAGILGYVRPFSARAMGALLYPLTYYFIFTNLCRRWLDDQTGEKANAFLSGGSRQIQLLSAFEDLWNFSRELKKNPGMSQRFLRSATPAKAENVLLELGDVAAWSAFLEKYGHRGAKEADFSQPRWKEDPGFLVDTLKLYLSSSEDANPTARLEKLAKKKEMLLWETKRRLPGWKFALLKKSLDSAESAQFAREYVKSVLICLLYPLRLVYLKLGLKMAETGSLYAAGDIFFLASDEIEAIRSGRLAVDGGIAQLAARRRNEHKKYLSMHMPDQIAGESQEFSAAAKEITKYATAGNLLLGVGVSSGIAQGTARVVLNTSDVAKIQLGDILVCDHLDPGLTPVFVVVKAVVSNTGGLLSHASIVAREYGLPAVVSLKNATLVIADGQKIIVDGNRGTVKIVDDNTIG